MTGGRAIVLRDDADHERKINLAAGLLSSLLALDEPDQLDVLAFTIVAWVCRRDRRVTP